MTDEPNPLSVRCPWCGSAVDENCTVAGSRRVNSHPSRVRAASEIPVQENRPTLTPKPNRPDRTLDQ